MEKKEPSDSVDPMWDGEFQANRQNEFVPRSSFQWFSQEEMTDLITCLKRSKYDVQVYTPQRVPLARLTQDFNMTTKGPIRYPTEVESVIHALRDTGE